MLFLGVDWAEDHHDVCVMDEARMVFDTRRVAHSVRGMAELYELVSEFAEEDEAVVVGIEVDRGLLVSALMGPRWAFRPDWPSQAGRSLSWSAALGCCRNRSNVGKVLTRVTRVENSKSLIRWNCRISVCRGVIADGYNLANFSDERAVGRFPC